MIFSNVKIIYYEHTNKMILLCDLSRGRNLRNSKMWDKRGSRDPDRHVGRFQGS